MGSAQRVRRIASMAVLDQDPELADGVPAEELERARRHLVAPGVEVPAGVWHPPSLRSDYGGLGLLVVEGLVARCVTLAGRTTGELLGAGDLLRPWELEEGMPPVPVAIEWTVVAPLRLALLDRRFNAALVRFPQVLEQVTARTVRRSRGLVLQLSVGQVPRVEGRLLLLFWRLAERWGRMTPDGPVLPLRLTHELLAALVSARRPSVTSALGRLADAGLLRRVEGGWLLSRASSRVLDEYLVAHGGGDVRTVAGAR